MAEKTVAIVQSNYIPWKGYFDLISRVDEFILLDDAQYTRRDWRNRNRIKTAQGLRWLSVPVVVKGRYHQRIDETLIADAGWGRSHWDAIRQAYREAPHLDHAAAVFEPLYADPPSDRLSEVNEAFLRAACDALGIGTRLARSTDYGEGGAKTERLVRLCAAAGATRYVSGPAARDYLDEAAFGEHGIAVEWMEYSGYPPYEQPHGEFEHHVSVVDLIACTGPDAARHARPAAAEPVR